MRGSKIFSAKPTTRAETKLMMTRIPERNLTRRRICYKSNHANNPCDGEQPLGLSQLSRPRDGDANRRPNRFSLKESGSLENDASLVVLVFRPTNQYGQPTFADELIIAKQRNGPVGVELVRFSETLKFYERTPYRNEETTTYRAKGSE